MAARNELRRLAGGNLLNLAHVCSQWREVFRITPALWTCVSIDLRAWETETPCKEVPQSLHEVVEMLDTALTRGGILPLEVEAVVTQCHPIALETLTRSSPRWRSVSFHLDPAMIPHFEGIRNNLPLLEDVRLRFFSEDIPALKAMLGYFSDAPRLSTLDYLGPIEALEHFPITLLQRYSSTRLGPGDLRPFIELLGRCSNGDFHAHLDLDAFSEADLPLRLPFVASALRELCISVTGSQSGTLSKRILGEIFDAIRNPVWYHFYLVAATDDGQPIYWPHPQGLAFFQRSKLERSTLAILHLYDIIITEDELVECLADMPMLKDLFVTDYAAGEALPDQRPHVLITDNLLRKLASNADDSQHLKGIAPILATFQFKTVGEFTDEVLVEFVTKRVAVQSFHWDEEPFSCYVSWIPGYARNLGPQHMNTLGDFESNGELWFVIDELEDDSD
ncbi:hypothetical protein R3P38DRAFT_2680919, partial [Favolaschia claudopus]